MKVSSRHLNRLQGQQSQEGEPDAEDRQKEKIEPVVVYPFTSTTAGRDGKDRDEGEAASQHGVQQMEYVRVAEADGETVLKDQRSNCDNCREHSNLRSDILLAAVAGAQS